MSEADGAELVVERIGAVLLLRLNRPEARNALTPTLLDALGAAVDEADADPDVRCIVLTGTGDRAFCAGMDLRAFAADPDGVSAGGPARLEPFMRLVRGESATPIVGAINGTAVAGGLELLLACDLVVASRDAMFGLPEVTRGLFAGGRGMLLGTRIPLAFALEFALTGDRFDATRALELGLINRVVDPAHVMGVALDLATRIAANAPLAVQATKELVRTAAGDVTKAWERQAEWAPRVFGSNDAREGATAFVEKRTPNWTGT